MYRFITYGLVSILLFGFKIALAKPVPVLKYDTTVTKQLRPSAVQEQQVFEDVDLSFAKTEESNDTGFFERFITWLLELLFGKADHENRVILQWSFIGILAIGGIIMIIWLFRKGDFGSFLKGNTKHSAFNFADVDEDISSIDFNRKIQEAKTGRDYRLAVRWLYLKQLYLLNEKNQIAWQPYKTNMDYANELKNSTHRQSFKSISKVYEYVWYGKYEVNEQSYGQLELQFKQFEITIGV